ncbi:M-phase inducer phosphatase 2 isoform X2 [Microcaecilia unicolor]|uniref:M-phase inducer phosphatase n=1 Tax=Microcaecilia unicolor TaxID=1415580 RepID=A0A6P7X321_9AMPH|nr:M-phase inducer phosphatase 2 isoform X2 [Microcaecilia unicolor]
MDLEEILSDFSPCGSGSMARPSMLSGLSSIAGGKGLLSPQAGVMSPVSNLTLNLNSLTGLGSYCDTPKRKPAMALKSSTSSLVRTDSGESFDSGLGLDSPSPLDPVVINDNTSLSIRRIHSLPVKLLCASPSLRNISNSPDLDVCKLTENTSAFEEEEEDKENEACVFKRPSSRPVSRLRLRTYSARNEKEAFAQRPNSAPALMFTPEKEDPVMESESPVLLRRSSLTFCLNNDEEDDGFMDILDEEDRKNDSDVPSGMENLLTAPLVKSEEIDPDEIIRSKCRRLFRSPSLPSRAIRAVLKRMGRPEDDDKTPVKSKRRKSITGGAIDENLRKEEPKMRFGRSKSFCHDQIENILDNDQRELIGDFSKAYLLKTIEGRHQDLKYITAEMMIAVLSGKFKALVEHCVVIDCRYPYEYEGGHIKGAINLPMEQDVEDYLLKNPIVPFHQDKRVILIFHCEFSSERGPRMCRFIREKDRMKNEYPNLHYPELYILKGGYKEFFPKYQGHCEPQGYRPMHHEDFKEDLKKFRTKSRTWAGERSKRELYNRLKNL